MARAATVAAISVLVGAAVALAIWLLVKLMKKRDAYMSRDDDYADDVDCEKVQKNVAKLCGQGASLAKIARKYDKGELSTCSVDVRAVCDEERSNWRDTAENPDASKCKKKCKSPLLKFEKPCASDDGKQCCNAKGEHCVNANIDNVAIANQMRSEGTGHTTVEAASAMNVDSCDYAGRVPDPAAKGGWNCPKNFPKFVGEYWLDKLNEQGQFYRQCAASNECNKKTLAMLKEKYPNENW